MGELEQSCLDQKMKAVSLGGTEVSTLGLLDEREINLHLVSAIVLKKCDKKKVVGREF